MSDIHYTAVVEIHHSESGKGDRSIKQEVVRLVLRDDDLSTLIEKTRLHLALVEGPPVSSR